MALRATVLIPTFDHGPLLSRAVDSALRQTVSNIEVLVVGDGVPDVTRELMAEMIRRDDRVRFFDNPKGPRHGELHRHAALAEAQGQIVCYLSDDDLYLPEHIETMHGLLQDADFASALPIHVAGDGEATLQTLDLACTAHRQFILEQDNRIPLSCGAHTLQLYRELPHGWRTTPPGTPTDLYMWRQILRMPECRAVSAMRPTVLNFPSPSRKTMSADERLAELDAWQERVGSPEGRGALIERMLEAKVREAAAKDARLSEMKARLRAIRASWLWTIHRVGIRIPGLWRLFRIDGDGRG